MLFRSADGIILGPVSHQDYPPRAQGGRNPSGDLRILLDLYANIRPARSREGIPHYGRTPMDLVIVRENTEDLYAGLEHTVVPGVVESLKIITEAASTRIAEFAFEQARRRGRRRVTAVHKANIMKLSDGLFLECARKVSTRYPDIQFDDQIGRAHV